MEKETVSIVHSLNEVKNHLDNRILSLEEINRRLKLNVSLLRKVVAAQQRQVLPEAARPASSAEEGQENLSLPVDRSREVVVGSTPFKSAAAEERCDAQQRPDRPSAAVAAVKSQELENSHSDEPIDQKLDRILQLAKLTRSSSSSSKKGSAEVKTSSSSSSSNKKTNKAAVIKPESLREAFIKAASSSSTPAPAPLPSTSSTKVKPPLPVLSSSGDVKSIPEPSSGGSPSDKVLLVKRQLEWLRSLRRSFLMQLSHLLLKVLSQRTLPLVDGYASSPIGSSLLQSLCSRLIAYKDRVLNADQRQVLAQELINTGRRLKEFCDNKPNRRTEQELAGMMLAWYKTIVLKTLLGCPVPEVSYRAKSLISLPLYSCHSQLVVLADRLKQADNLSDAANSARKWKKFVKHRLDIVAKRVTGNIYLTIEHQLNDSLQPRLVLMFDACLSKEHWQQALTLLRSSMNVLCYGGNSAQCIFFLRK
eukprot:scaffold2507_cov257-Ochromonas_danica.AAC.25